MKKKIAGLAFFYFLGLPLYAEEGVSGREAMFSETAAASAAQGNPNQKLSKSARKKLRRAAAAAQNALTDSAPAEQNGQPLPPHQEPDSTAENGQALPVTAAKPIAKAPTAASPAPKKGPKPPPGYHSPVYPYWVTTGLPISEVETINLPAPHRWLLTTLLTVFNLKNERGKDLHSGKVIRRRLIRAFDVALQVYSQRSSGFLKDETGQETGKIASLFEYAYLSEPTRGPYSDIRQNFEYVLDRYAESESDSRSQMIALSDDVIGNPGLFESEGVRQQVAAYKEEKDRNQQKMIDKFSEGNLATSDIAITLFLEMFLSLKKSFSTFHGTPDALRTVAWLSDLLNSFAGSAANLRIKDLKQTIEDKVASNRGAENSKTGDIARMAADMLDDFFELFKSEEKLLAFVQKSKDYLEKYPIKTEEMLETFNLDLPKIIRRNLVDNLARHYSQRTESDVGSKEQVEQEQAINNLFVTRVSAFSEQDIANTLFRLLNGKVHRNVAEANKETLRIIAQPFPPAVVNAFQRFGEMGPEPVRDMSRSLLSSAFSESNEEAYATILESKAYREGYLEFVPPGTDLNWVRQQSLEPRNKGKLYFLDFVLTSPKTGKMWQTYIGRDNEGFKAIFKGKEVRVALSVFKRSMQSKLTIPEDEIVDAAQAVSKIIRDPDREHNHASITSLVELMTHYVRNIKKETDAYATALNALAASMRLSSVNHYDIHTKKFTVNTMVPSSFLIKGEDLIRISEFAPANVDHTDYAEMDEKERAAIAVSLSKGTAKELFFPYKVAPGDLGEMHPVWAKTVNWLKVRMVSINYETMELIFPPSYSSAKKREFMQTEIDPAKDFGYENIFVTSFGQHWEGVKNARFDEGFAQGDPNLGNFRVWRSEKEDRVIIDIRQIDWGLEGRIDLVYLKSLWKMYVGISRDNLNMATDGLSALVRSGLESRGVENQERLEEEVRIVISHFKKLYWTNRDLGRDERLGSYLSKLFLVKDAPLPTDLLLAEPALDFVDNVVTQYPFGSERAQILQAEAFQELWDQYAGYVFDLVTKGMKGIRGISTRMCKYFFVKNAVKQ